MAAKGGFEKEEDGIDMLSEALMYETKMDAMRAEKELHTCVDTIAGEWILDSGANTAVVGRGDPSIMKDMGTKVCVRTAHGEVECPEVIVKTPVGTTKAVVMEGNKRLLPIFVARSLEQIQK